MASLSQGSLVVVFGGSGFVGRHVVQSLTKQGYRVRVAVRRPNEALFLKTAGRVGQVEIVAANLRHSASVEAALQGAHAVVNSVGILFESGKQKFTALQADGVANLAALAAQNNIQNVVQISAIGASQQSASLYAQSKAQGEASLLEDIPTAHILRPSIVVGPEDDFFNRFASMALVAPALPLIGGGATRYQPVSVFDVAAAVTACLGGAPAGIYELGGPQIYSFKELLELLLVEIGRKRLLLPLPFFVARMMASVTQFMPTPILTPDQLILLKSDNIVTPEFANKGLDALGVAATPIETLLPTYLRRFRPDIRTS
jgi:uncharacterized protein YbjT (DUF2867 family)